MEETREPSEITPNPLVIGNFLTCPGLDLNPYSSGRHLANSGNALDHFLASHDLPEMWQKFQIPYTPQKLWCMW